MSFLDTIRLDLSSAKTSLHDLFDTHRHLSEIHQDTDPLNAPLSEHAKRLMKFNGYYQLSSGNGAFIAVDTNLIVKEGATAPITDVSLLISLDGKIAQRLPFTGTFDGRHLVQNDGGVDIDLIFYHINTGIDGVARCDGAVRLATMPSMDVWGVTYNNPIPYSVFVGDYFLGDVPVLRIHEDYSLHYDFGSGNGKLVPIKSYIYNPNMFFFSLQDGTKMIMGTGAGKGLVCNNILPEAGARTLLTIPSPDKTPFPNEHSAELAKFSGYYQLPSIAPRAFVSIQGEYRCRNGVIDRHMVWIGVSTDGVTAKNYYFDRSMSFKNDVLATPDLTLTFERRFDEETGTLATVSGTVAGHEGVRGHTYFNPVPLSDFGGATMTNSAGNSLTVLSDTVIEYNDVSWNDFTYVPIMYILAAPATNPALLLSFGTDGVSGNACIVTDAAGVCYVLQGPPAAP